MNTGGLILEAPRIKDFSHELVFGGAPFLEPIVPFNRDYSGLPIVYQGNIPSCVSCTLTWIRQYLDKNKPNLSWEWLADISHTGTNGAKPSQVLEPARKLGITTDEIFNSSLTFEEKLQRAFEYRLPNYFYVTDLSKYGIYHALKTSPLAIGVRDWKGVGPHFMAAIDVTPDGSQLVCMNWWNANIQTVEYVPFEAVVVAVAFGQLPENVTKQQARLPLYKALNAKLCFLYKKYVSS